MNQRSTYKSPRTGTGAKESNGTVLWLISNRPKNVKVSVHVMVNVVEAKQKNCLQLDTSSTIRFVETPVRKVGSLYYPF